MHHDDNFHTEYPFNAASKLTPYEACERLIRVFSESHNQSDHHVREQVRDLAPKTDGLLNKPLFKFGNRTLLTFASLYASTAALGALLETETIDVNAKDGKGTLPLLCALMTANTPLNNRSVVLGQANTCLLIQHGAEMDRAGTNPYLLDTPPLITATAFLEKYHSWNANCETLARQLVTAQDAKVTAAPKTTAPQKLAPQSA